MFRGSYRKNTSSHWDYGLAAWVEPKAEGFADAIIHTWESGSDAFSFASVFKADNESIILLDVHTWIFSDNRETTTLHWDAIVNDWADNPFHIREALHALFTGYTISRLDMDPHPMLEIPSVDAQLAPYRGYVTDEEYDRMSALMFEQRFGELCHVNQKWTALRNSPEALVAISWGMTTN